MFARYPLAVLIAALPLACLVLARYPVVIPLVLYIGLVPLDATLPLQGFGSVTRLLGDRRGRDRGMYDRIASRAGHIGFTDAPRLGSDDRLAGGE